MAKGTIRHTRNRLTPRKPPREDVKGVVLVGTYKDRQLEWIERNGVYNYPVRDGDELTDEACAKVRELWLYADAKAIRHAFAAEFVGKMTREEFVAAHPSYAKLGPSGNGAYYVFKATPVRYGTLTDGCLVIARTADFGRRTSKVKKAIKQFRADGEFAPLKVYLPADLADVPQRQLRVCEAAVQLEFLCAMDHDIFQMRVCESRSAAETARQDGKLTCVEICAGAGGQAIGLERAGFSHVALVEYESEYCAVLKQNNPTWNVICADVHKFDGRPYRGVDLLAGGVPCPPFSVASKQLGKDDERDLFPEALRLIGEIQP